MQIDFHQGSLRLHDCDQATVEKIVQPIPMVNDTRQGCWICDAMHVAPLCEILGIAATQSPDQNTPMLARHGIATNTKSHPRLCLKRGLTRWSRDNFLRISNLAGEGQTGTVKMLLKGFELQAMDNTLPLGKSASKGRRGTQYSTKTTLHGRCRVRPSRNGRVSTPDRIQDDHQYFHHPRVRPLFTQSLGTQREQVMPKRLKTIARNPRSPRSNGEQQT